MTLGGVVGHSICTGAAVLGGRHLASYVDERTMSLLGGLLFIAFGAHAYWEVRSCQSVYVCVCAYSLSSWAEYLPSYYKSKRECRHARQSERHSRMKGLPGNQQIASSIKAPPGPGALCVATLTRPVQYCRGN